jgi:hypothetical protein
MNQDFYAREQESRQHEERLRAQAEKHQTLETVQIEQNAAQDGVPSALGEQKSARPGLLARLKRRFLKT